MTIPEHINKSHLLAAIKLLEQQGEASWRKSTKFDLYYNGKRYPPKEVIRHAALVADGALLWSFSGGVEANNFLMKQGCCIVYKGTMMPIPGSVGPLHEDEVPIDIEQDNKDRYEQNENEAVQMLKEINSDYLTETDKEAIIKARVGQSIFKEKLLAREQKCQLCGLSNKHFLIASHMKPWKHANDQERLDVNNGLLLCPNHDALFDKGYISFTDVGELIVSPSLDEETLLFLNIRKSLQIQLLPEQQKYMNWHRKNLFQNT